MDERSDHREIVSACERVQTAWFQVRAERLGGQVWADRGLTWIDGPDGCNLMFPDTVDTDAVQAGVEKARELGRELVAVWLATDKDATGLVNLGFERGGAPWWMAAPLDEVDMTGDPRVHVGVEPADIEDEERIDGHGDWLRLAELEPGHAFYAAVRVDGALAGHAWVLIEGEYAGIFDLEIFRPYRRHGLGAALVHAVGRLARDAGARTAVLGTTPQDSIVYRAQGFTRVGMGATWWLNLS